MKLESKQETSPGVAYEKSFSLLLVQELFPLQHMGNRKKEEKENTYKIKSTRTVEIALKFLLDSGKIYESSSYKQGGKKRTRRR